MVSNHPTGQHPQWSHRRIATICEIGCSFNVHTSQSHLNGPLNGNHPRPPSGCIPGSLLFHFWQWPWCFLDVQSINFWSCESIFKHVHNYEVLIGFSWNFFHILDFISLMKKNFGNPSDSSCRSIIQADTSVFFSRLRHRLDKENFFRKHCFFLRYLFFPLLFFPHLLLKLCSNPNH